LSSAVPMASPTAPVPKMPIFILPILFLKFTL
jgi:hypothetical protein